MKQRIIDWMRDDILRGWGEWTKLTNTDDDGHYIRNIIDKLAVEKGTALYLHLFKDRGDIQEFYSDIFNLEED